MIKQLLTSIFLFTCASSEAQVNLVQNPSFEQYSQCPSLYDQINYANYWSGADSTNVNGCTPEYLNMCATSGYVSVPSNGNYYQYPRTGNGMGLILTYFDVTITYNRDYLLGRLSNNLVDGQSYCVTFYVSPYENYGYFADKVGAYLDSGGACIANSCNPLTQFHPQIENTSGVISDTLNWTKIEGTFIANGSERFITIGNFYSLGNTNTLYAYGSAPGAYYLIDDVSVIPSNLPAYAGGDTWVALGDSVYIGRPKEIGLECKWYIGTNVVDSGAGIWVKPTTTTTYVVEQTLCGLIKRDTVVVSVFPTAVNGITNSKQLSIYPNPASTELSINMELPIFSHVNILNSLGQMVSTHSITQQETKLDISSLPKGVYYLQLSGEKGREVRSFVKM